MVIKLKRSFTFSTDEIFLILTKHLKDHGSMRNINDEELGLAYSFAGELEYLDDRADEFFIITSIEETEIVND